jgi:hypothetical protein
MSFNQITRDMGTSLKRVGQQPEVKRESDYFLKTIGSVKSMDAFLANDRVYRYAMKAFGLSDMIYAKAFVRKVLTDGIDSSKSFANQLADPRFRDLAATFNFKAHGSATTAFDKAQQGVVDKYVQAQLEEQAGSQNEGVRLALYFQRKASGITSAYSILADPALLKVAQVALGLPAASSAASIDTQAAMIKSKVDIDRLDEPAVLTKFLARFTSLWELNNGGSGSASSSLATLYGGSAQSVTSPDLLLSIQSLRWRGR